MGKDCNATYDKGVTLASEDLEGVDTVGLGADAIGLNDGQVVVVDAEDEVRLARQGDEPEAVAGLRWISQGVPQVANRYCSPLALGHVHNSQVTGARGRRTTESVDQDGIQLPKESQQVNSEASKKDITRTWGSDRHWQQGDTNLPR